MQQVSFLRVTDGNLGNNKQNMSI